MAMTGSYDTITHVNNSSRGRFCYLSYGWVASSGSVASTDAEAIAAGLPTISGAVLRVVTTPDSGGTQPDDDYDVTLLDSFGIDVLGGSGANRDETNSEHVNLTTPVVVNSALRLQVSNAGGSNGGTVTIYYERS